MKLTTIPTQVFVHSVQLADCRQRWHARVQRISCSHFSVTKTTGRTGSSHFAEVGPFPNSHATTATSIEFGTSLVSILKSIALVRRLEKCETETKGRRRTFSLLLWLLVIWLVLPVLPLSCRSLFVSHATLVKRKRSAEALVSNSTRASFPSVPFADETVCEERTHVCTRLKRSNKYHERDHVLPRRQRTPPFSYIASTDVLASQPLIPSSLKRYKKIQSSLLMPAQLSPRLYSEGLRPHLPTGSLDGTDSARVANNPSHPIPHSAHPFPSSFFSKNYAASSARQASSISTPSLSSRHIDQNIPKGKKEHVPTPWKVSFRITGPPVGHFQRSRESNGGCSNVKDRRLQCTTRKGTYMSQLTVMQMPSHTATGTSPYSLSVTHEDLNGQNVLPRCATPFSSAFVGVDDEEEEEEEEDSVTETKEEKKKVAAPNGKGGAVSSQGEKPEDEEDETSEQEEASEKEHEVEAAEEKEEKEEEMKKAKGEKEQVPTDENEAEAEEEEEEATSKHKSAEAEKKTETGKHEKGPTVSEAKAEHPPTTHTLIKKKSPDYVPAWATGPSKRTAAVAEKPADGTPRLLTEQPVVLHSALKPIAKIYYRQNHKKKTLKTGGHIEKLGKEEKAYMGTRERQASKGGERSVNRDHDAGKHHKVEEGAHIEEAETHKDAGEEHHKRVGGPHKEEAETHETAAEKEQTVTEAHTAAGEKSGDTKADHFNNNPPVLLHGQPVVTGSAIPAISGLPLQAQQLVEGAPSFTPAVAPGAGLPAPISPVLSPTAPSLPTPGPAENIPLQLPTVPMVVQPVATATPTAGSPIRAAAVIPTTNSPISATAVTPTTGIPISAAAVPAVVATTPGLAAGTQQSSPATVPIPTTPGGDLFPPSVSVGPQGITDAATAAAVQKAVLSTAIADEALREQMQQNMQSAIAREQKAEQEKSEQWSAAGITTIVLLSVVGTAGVAGLVYYFYDKITRSIQRMRRKYAEVLETRRRERDMRRKEEEGEVEELYISEEAQESVAPARRGIAPHRSTRGSSHDR